MRPPPEPLFLERQNYRRRRIRDAARILPFVGLFAFLVPVMWTEHAITASGMIYVFAAWVLLIVLSAVVSRALARDATRGDPQDGGEAR